MASRVLFCVLLLLPGLLVARAVIDRRPYRQDDLHQRDLYLVGVSHWPDELLGNSNSTTAAAEAHGDEQAAESVHLIEQSAFTTLIKLHAAQLCSSKYGLLHSSFGCT